MKWVIAYHLVGLSKLGNLKDIDLKQILKKRENIGIIRGEFWVQSNTIK